MIIECAHCHAKYNYDPARFEGKPSKKIKCAKCQQVFEIHNPEVKKATSAATVAIPRPPVPAPAPAAPPKPSPPPAAPPKPAPAAAPTPVIPPKTEPGVVNLRGEQLDMTMRGRQRTDEPAAPSAPPAEPSMPPGDTTPRLPVGRRLSLAILDGPDAGKVLRIEKPKVTIGRSGADLVLNDNEASRHHAALEVRDNVVLLQDLGSTNGTLVDGTKIDGLVEIVNQSEFQVGTSVLMLIVTEDESAAAPSR